MNDINEDNWDPAIHGYCGQEMKKPVGIAKFSKSDNDLFWEYWCDICMNDDIKKWSNCKNRRISWDGYDDRYWWDKVSKAEQATIRELPCGKKLQIGHRGYVSEEVFEVEG
jgi:hypothetical protein